MEMKLNEIIKLFLLASFSFRFSLFLHYAKETRLNENT